MSSLWPQADLVRSDDSYCRLSQPAAGYSLRGDARSAADRQAVREASEGGTVTQGQRVELAQRYHAWHLT